MAGAIVQSVFAVDDSGANATTLAAVLNSVVAGNHLVSHCGWTDSGAITCSVSDGTAFSTGDSKRNDATEVQSGQVFYRENVGSGTHTSTATFSTTTSFRRHRSFEVSGLATSSSLDKNVGQVQVTPGTGANAISSTATAATTNATDYVMGFTQDSGNASPGSGTLSAGTGYTISGTNVTMGCEAKSVAATGAQTATFTQSVGAPRITHVVAFKESGGGGDVTLALTGQAMASAAGTLVPALSRALTGQVAASSAGTLAPATSNALSGSALTSTAGTLVPTLSRALSGQAMTGLLGTLVPALSIPLSGLLITIGQGSLTAPGGGGDVTAALTGIAISTAQGALAPSTSKALSGSALAMGLGTLIPGTSKALTGSSLTSAQGSIGPTLAVAMVGSVITASTGTLTDPSAISGAIDNTRIVRVTVRMDLRVKTPDTTLRVTSPKTTIH